MAEYLVQPSFAGGELAPSLFGRVDVARYHIGCSTLRNMWVNMRGGAYSRAGTLFVGYSRTPPPYPPRLIDFQFSLNQGRCLEFGDHYMRVIFDGAFVTEAAFNIVGINNANPGVASVPGNNFANGDWIYLSGIGGMTELNGQIVVASSVSPGTFVLQDVFGNNIDTSTFGLYTGGGTAARIFTLTTPWAAIDLPYLKWTQSADTLSICCWNQQTGTDYQPYDLARISDTNWTVTPFNPSNVISPPATTSGVATVPPGGSISPLPTDYKYVVTAIDRITGQESSASVAADIPNSTNIALTAGSIVLKWSPVAGAGHYNVYKAQPAYNGTVPVGVLYGVIGTAYGTSFIDTNIVPDFSQVPPVHGDPFSPGQIISYTVTNGGGGFSSASPPTVIISDPTGSGAVAQAVVDDSTGKVVAVISITGGQNYTNPTVSFGGAPGGINFAATAVPNGHGLWDGGAPSSQSGIHISNGGSGYPANVQLIAQFSVNGVPYNFVATSVTVSGGVIISATFPVTANGQKPVATSVVITAGTPGVGATATATVGPTTGTYPGVVSYFQQRRAYAATPNLPDTYFMSQPGAFLNFDSRVPPVDTDAIIGTPWSQQVNGIQFMVPMPGGLVVLTGVEAWQITGGGGGPFNVQAITPTSQQATPQAFNGCSDHVPPIRIDWDLNYVQAKGSIFRDLAYNFWANIYTGTDLTYLSPHLFFAHKILEMAWCEEPFRLIWATRDDGILLSLTYFKQQEVMAWARHDTLGQIFSLASVTEPPVDALYMATQRPLG